MDHHGHGSSARDEAIGRIVTMLPRFSSEYLDALASGLRDELQQGSFGRLRLCRLDPLQVTQLPDVDIP